MTVLSSVVVDFARRQPGVVAISMSWGADEFAGESSYNPFFTTPDGHIGGNGLPGGVTFVAASGDRPSTSGPAVSPNVLRTVASITVQSSKHTPCAVEPLADGTWKVPATLARTVIDAPVLSVGGTTLALDDGGNRISETAWDSSGGGGWPSLRTPHPRLWPTTPTRARASRYTTPSRIRARAVGSSSAGPASDHPSGRR